MDIAVANLYKRFQTGSLPRLDENTFSLIGHFDYLQFSIVPFRKLSDQFEDRNVQRQIHPAWTGFHSQSLYLLRFPDGDEDFSEPLNTLISSKDETFPFCIMATIEDSDQFEVEKPPFKSEDILRKLNVYRAKYTTAFQRFMEKRADRASLSAKMEVFFTLSCIDTVLLFRTNSFSLIHDFIFELYMNGDRLMSYTMYGISAGYDLCAHKEEIEADDNLLLSMRISFNPNINPSGMQQIDKSIRSLTNNQSLSSIPAGRYHYLYYITQGVYNVLNACLKANGKLSLSDSNNGYCKYVNGHRFTLSFRNAQALTCSSVQDDVQPDTDIRKETHLVYNAFKELNLHWEKQIENKSEADKVIIADLKAYAITVENTVREYMYFFACVDSHTRHMINYELSVSIIDPLKKLGQMISDFKEYVISLLEEDVSNTVKMYELFLRQIQSVISKFGNQVEDIIHMQQNRLEDRGVYRNDIAATAKLCLGYYSYAQLLSDALFSTDRDSVTHSNKNPFSFYINLETMSDPVNATEHFSSVLDHQHQYGLPTKGALVGIDISRQHVSDIFFVKASITHEIAHFVGWRNRVFRAECIIRSVSRMLSSFLIPDLHCKNTAEATIVELFKDRKSQINQATEEIRAKFADQIENRILKAFKESFEEGLEWAFQKNCEDVLLLILQCWLDSPNTEGKFGQIIMENYVDIPSLAVNLNTELNQKWGVIAFEWFREKKKDSNNVVTYLYDYLSGPVYSLNKAINNVKKWIDSIIDGEVYSPSIFYDVQYDEKTERLKPRTFITLTDRDTNIVEMPVSPEKKSLSGLVHTICNAYSEAYCDLVMVKLLHLSADQYIDYLYREGEMENDACWRIWSVLIAAYDFSSFDDGIKRRIRDIKENAGTYRRNDDMMQEYLKSILEDPGMQALFDCEQGWFIPTNDINAEEGNLLHLYACYLRLHG